MIGANEMIPANPSVKSSHIGSSQKSPMAFSKGSKFGMNDSEESSLSRDDKIFYQNLIQSFKETKGQTLESYKETKGQKNHTRSRVLSKKVQKNFKNKCCVLNNAQKSITDLLQEHLDVLTINPDHFLAKTQNIHAEKCIRKILSHLSNAIKNSNYKNGSHNLTIDLHSENLGSLHINIERGENTLRINFSAETPAAQKMLVKNLAVLKSSLSKQLNQQIREDQKMPLNQHEITLQVMQGNNEEIAQNISLPFQNPHSATDDTSDLLQEHLDVLTINPDHFLAKTQNIHTEKCIRKILSHLSNDIKNSNYKNGSRNLTIDLHSENLGSLHINIERGENTLRINFSAETPAAQKMLVKNLAVLKSSLSKHLNQQMREDQKMPLNQHEITLQVMQGNNKEIAQNISSAFQNPHSSTDDTSIFHHQKQGRRRRGRKASMTEINKENSETSSASKARLSFSENEQDPKIFPINSKSDEKQLFSRLPKPTGEFDNLANSAKKRSFTEHSGRIEHSGQVITKENAGSQIPSTKIPLSPEELIQQTLPQLSAHIKNNGHHLIIDLHPEYLGKLHITLEMKENMLKANIMTENPTVQKMLGENLAFLKSSLANQGVQVEHFSISVGEKGSDQNGGNKFADHSKKGEQKIKTIDSSSPASLSGAEQMGEQNKDNGINYLA